MDTGHVEQALFDQVEHVPHRFVIHQALGDHPGYGGDLVNAEGDGLGPQQRKVKL